jgi:tetratricopeptide (TPR) repeat protein
MMKKDATATIDEPLATEIAIREHLKAVLSCAISNVGEAYLLTAKVIDPQSGTAVSTESVQARGKDSVLAALDELATRVRQNLGESLSSVSAQRVALPRATTPSLEALRLYAESRQALDANLSRDLLAQALTLDPDFAMAHAALGHLDYLNQETETRKEGEEHFVKALSLLDRLSHRERLWISALAEDARGHREAAVAGYRTYLAEYPDDPTAWFRLGWSSLASLHQYEQAVEAFQRVIKLSPTDGAAHVNLATAYSGMGNFPESVKHYEFAFRLTPSLRTDTLINHEYGFVLVRLRKLDEAAAVFGEMIADKATSSQARGHRSMALLEMFRGRYASAIEHLRQAVVINKTNRSRLSEYRDRLYLARAYLSKGQQQEFRSELDAAHRIALEARLAPEWLRRVAKVEARAHRIPQTRAILAEMTKTAGDATAASSVNRSASSERAHFDVANGELALAEGRTAAAVDLFRSAFVVDAHVDTLESLATALASAGRAEEAAKAFEDLLSRDENGTEGMEQWFDAHVRLAEIYLRSGKPERAKSLCEELLNQWKDGDADLTLGREARALLAKMK